MTFRKSRSSRSTGSAARLSIAVLAILLLLLNAGGWILGTRLVRTQEYMVIRGMAQTAAYVARVIQPENLYFLEIAWDPSTETTDFETLAEYTELPPVEWLVDALGRASDNETTIAIVSPDGWLVADATGFYSEQIRPESYNSDIQLIATAAAGIAASNRDDHGDPSKRVWQPLVGEDGDVIALVRLENRTLSGFPRERIVRRLTLGSVLATILIVFLWWSLSRLVTRTLRAERVAEQGDRLRALGTATAGVAHEIRNPLGIILLTAEEIEAVAQKIVDDRRRRAVLDLTGDLKDEARRLGRLTDDFLALARDKSDPGLPQEIDVNRCCLQVVRLFSKGVSQSLKVDLEPTNEKIFVKFHDARLRQVLLNLLRNAQEALGQQDDGRIVLRTERRREFAVIEIIDNGPGLDAQTLARVFDPFYTTKSEGTGLGLSVSRSLVEAGKGMLELESEPDRSTTARVTLPLLAKNQSSD